MAITTIYSGGTIVQNSARENCEFYILRSDKMKRIAALTAAMMLFASTVFAESWETAASTTLGNYMIDVDSVTPLTVWDIESGRHEMIGARGRVRSPHEDYEALCKDGVIEFSRDGNHIVLQVVKDSFDGKIYEAMMKHAEDKVRAAEGE